MFWAQRQRQLIMDKIKNTFVQAAKQGLFLDEQRLISEICMTHGSTSRKAKEYIQELLDFGFIERKESGLILSEKFKVTPPPGAAEEADKILNNK